MAVVTATGTEPTDKAAPLWDRLATLPDDPLVPEKADAAVLIVLKLGNEGPEVLAEQRAERPGDPWSGHVGLPGGRKDPKDRSLAETVLRELHEEVALPPSALAGPPRLFDVRRARPSGLRVAVFAGRFVGGVEAFHGADPEEVAETFWFPLRALTGGVPRPRPTMFGEINVDTVDFDGHVVWGFTLRLLRDFETWLKSPDGAVPHPPTALRRWRSQAI